MIWDIILSLCLVAVRMWARREIKIMKAIAIRVADKSDLERQIRDLRQDIFLTAKNPNLARKTLKEKEEYQ